MSKRLHKCDAGCKDAFIYSAWKPYRTICEGSRKEGLHPKVRTDCTRDST